MNKQLKISLIIAGVALTLILAVYFIGRRVGKKQEEKNKPSSKDLPNSGQGVPMGWDPEPLAKELHDVMDGIFDSPVKKNEAFSKLANLQHDDMVVAVYNQFNGMFSKGPNDTLTSWIMDESSFNVLSVGSTIFNPLGAVFGGSGTDFRELSLQRLNNLNLP